MNRTAGIVIAIVVVLGLGYLLMSNSGPKAANGSVVTVNYVGTLENGTKFDASADHGGPLTFTLGPIATLNGQGYVIPGWEEGILGMSAGQKKHLVITPDKAYGNQQVGPIPPNSTLVFDVEMVKIDQAGATPVAPHFPTPPTLTQPTAEQQLQAQKATQEAQKQAAEKASTTKPVAPKKTK